MGRNNESDGNSVNLIGAGTKIKGNIQSEGDIRIDGTLIGTITSKGKVVVGSTGTVEGEITCENADISGTIKVKISVSNILLLKPTAKLTGDIVTSKLAIESGATFSGSCSMGAVVKDIAEASSSKDLDDNDVAEMAQKAAEKSA
ncbi:MAG TPA: polymer-forming cytoskeletal protein [Flavobacteriales bacterium]|nr:polymer-forming cytoskeletal protein [Flavobacteriales bacterium]HIO67996.1 polymer-forming cytoskeletal protein [Flavobacteriales bacterium]